MDLATLYTSSSATKTIPQCEIILRRHVLRQMCRECADHVAAKRPLIGKGSHVLALSVETGRTDAVTGRCGE